MFAWRLTFGLILVLGLAVPLGLPFFEALSQERAWQVWGDGERLASLLGNSIFLVVGTLALVLPAGIAGAVLLFRTQLPWRNFWLFLTVVALFVPVPVLVSAWQAVLGTTGWLPLWEDRPGQPWPSGLGPAIWVNSLAMLPWVILLVGQGLLQVEGELEEDALLVAGPWQVVWRVTLPRCRAVIWAAALWVGLQTAGDITVTDMLEVRTFAEEVFFQFSAGEEARAVLVSLPAVGVVWLGVIWLVPRLDRALPPWQSLTNPVPLIRPGRAGWLLSAVTMGLVILLAGIPLASLIWKAGLHGQPLVWSGVEVWNNVGGRFQFLGGKIAFNLLLAAAAGVGVTGLALISCWAAGDLAVLRWGC